MGLGLGLARQVCYFKRFWYFTYVSTPFKKFRAINRKSVRAEELKNACVSCFWMGVATTL